MKISFSTYTDKGDREINEDSLRIVNSGEKYCFILCDGLGGHGKGDLASSFVTEHLAKAFTETDSTEAFYDNALNDAQNALLDEQKRIGAQFEMKTTAVMLVIENEHFRYQFIGDSRIYHFRNGKVSERSLDHSVPQMLALAGDIKEKKIRKHPDRNRLLRVMGVKWEASRYETSELNEIKPGDAFLLCSDGFWEPITEKEMCKLLKKSSTAEEWLYLMSERVKSNGAGTDMDNNSAVAVLVTE